MRPTTRGYALPQIWMTYDELAALIGSDPRTARVVAVEMTLDRRRSHDGRSRVRLNPDRPGAHHD
jgi:hypothetical protein